MLNIETVEPHPPQKPHSSLGCPHVPLGAVTPAASRGAAGSRPAARVQWFLRCRRGCCGSARLRPDNGGRSRHTGMETAPPLQTRRGSWPRCPLWIAKGLQQETAEQQAGTARWAPLGQQARGSTNSAAVAELFTSWRGGAKQLLLKKVGKTPELQLRHCRGGWAAAAQLPETAEGPPGIADWSWLVPGPRLCRGPGGHTLALGFTRAEQQEAKPESSVTVPKQKLP